MSFESKMTERWLKSMAWISFYNQRRCNICIEYSKESSDMSFERAKDALGNAPVFAYVTYRLKIGCNGWRTINYTIRISNISPLFFDEKSKLFYQKEAL